MVVKDNNAALIVHSCDSYEFLYQGFNYFFKKYWGSEINCNKYFASEDLSVTFPNFTNINSGKGEWSDRLRFLLEYKIKEPYVIYMQEDMWLTKTVNTNLMNELIELMAAKNWMQLKLHSSDAYKTKSIDLYIEGFNVAEIDNELSGFLMSHQISIWNRNFLISQLHKNEHPWRNERKSTKRLKKLNPKIYHVDCFAENGQKEINLNKNFVRRSEYFAVSTNGMLNSNVLLFINDLQQDYQQKDYAEKLLSNYTNKITHNGKARPKKTDIFKRIKNLLTKK